MRIPALLAGKSASVLSRALGRGSGMTIPGVIGERLHPDLVRDLASHLRDGATVITGTNGKTTTAKMFGDMLSEAGHRVVRNDSGSNMRQGIASTFVQSAGALGRSLSGDIAVLEVDEASMPAVVPLVAPRLICVTNLFRDQLDRYGDLDTISQRIGSALSMAPGATVLLNADDPIVVGLARYAAGPVLYFGIDDASHGGPANGRRILDSRCPQCGSTLNFEHVNYGHLGDWCCPACGLSRPPLDFSARSVELERDTSSFRSHLCGEDVAISLPAAGMHSVYNALAAAACGALCGVPATGISASLGEFTAAFGRTEQLDLHGTPITLLLAKNPIGAQQSLATTLASDEPHAIALALNDNAADGTDVSWIWDIDLESLDFSKSSVMLCGGRAHDLALRFKYAGITPRQLRVSTNPIEAVRTLAGLAPRGGGCSVLATYTAMLEIRNAFTPSGDQFARLGRGLSI